MIWPLKDNAEIRSVIVFSRPKANLTEGGRRHSLPMLVRFQMMRPYQTISGEFIFSLFSRSNRASRSFVGLQKSSQLKGIWFMSSGMNTLLRL